MKKIRKKKSVGNLTMDIVIWVILLAAGLLALYPMWYVLVASFMDATDLTKSTGILLWPKEPDITAYSLVFKNKLLLSGLKNSVKILILSLPLSIVMTLLCGYFMACSGMMFKKIIVFMIMFTMFFGGGLIPTYLNIRSLGLYDTVWALVVPGCLSVYNSIICKTSIEAIPDSLKESAYLDGANDFHIIFRIVVPLIKATLAVLLLYYGVSTWNSWYSASIYLTEDTDMPIQSILRAILIANKTLGGDMDSGDSYNAYAETIKYAAIIVSTVPVLCIYPFLQKYFAKGALIGAVKG